MFAEKMKTRGASYGFEAYPGSHSYHLWRIRLPDFFVFASVSSSLVDSERQEGNQGLVNVARVVRASRSAPTHVALLQGFLRRRPCAALEFRRSYRRSLQPPNSQSHERGVGTVSEGYALP